MIKYTYHYSITLTHYLWDAPRKYHGFLSLGMRIESEQDYNDICEQLKEKHGSGLEEYLRATEIHVDSLNFLGQVVVLKSEIDNR